MHFISFIYLFMVHDTVFFRNQLLINLLTKSLRTFQIIRMNTFPSSFDNSCNKTVTVPISQICRKDTLMLVTEIELNINFERVETAINLCDKLCQDGDPWYCNQLIKGLQTVQAAF